MRLYEAQHELVTQHLACGSPRAFEDMYEDKITWSLRDTELYAYTVWDAEGILWYEVNTRCVTLRANTLAHRAALNSALPPGLRVKSVKRGRWVVTGLDNTRQVPFHNGIVLYDTGENWVVNNVLPYPDKTHIPKPIQKMVKAWAANYTQGSNHGACGLCIAHNEGLMEFDEANHLLEHVLSGTLPFVMMDTIVKHTVTAIGRTLSVWDVTPFRQACFQIAVAYAYKTLRSTYV